MKTKILILATLLGAQALPSNGQGFINLNFELATVDQSFPEDQTLEWQSAVPGWSHSSGMDTGWVYYIAEHTGISQAFLLVDAAASPDYVPLEGSYSLAFQSGLDGNSPSTPWVNAYLSQTGLVPADALSLHFLATGNFAVSMNGNPLTPYSLGNNEYAVDISPYAGSMSELKILNVNPAPNLSMGHGRCFHLLASACARAEYVLALRLRRARRLYYPAESHENQIKDLLQVQLALATFALDSDIKIGNNNHISMAALTPSLKQPPTGFRCFSEFASLGLQSRRYAPLHRLRAVTVSCAEKFSRPPLRPPCNGKKLRDRNSVGPTIPLRASQSRGVGGPNTSGVSRLPPAFSKMSGHPTFTPHFQGLTSGHVVRIRQSCPDTKDQRTGNILSVWVGQSAAPARGHGNLRQQPNPVRRTGCGD